MVMSARPLPRAGAPRRRERLFPVTLAPSLALALALTLALTLALGGARAAMAQPVVTPCPEGVAPAAKCLTGRDTAGAHYWLVMPANWNGVLIVHAHGGPELGDPKADRAAADLTRWSVWTRAGYAYAGSGFHSGGVAVRSAAEDVERSRLLFIAQFGAPKRTVLHGQSWGAGVAVKTAEIFANRAIASGEKSPYDAVFLSSGVLGGGTPSYDFRLDLRVVYQAVCGNHPRATEAAYPLWQGLPLTAKMTRAELADRVDACTGVRRPAAQRTPEQARNLKTILDVTTIAESALISHMNWATWHFQDIAFNRLDGRNPFDNTKVTYRGSADDAALNTRVQRYAADPVAAAAFRADAGYDGGIPVPVMSIHATQDPTAFVELESTFRERMERGGSGARLVQLFTDDRDHSYLSDAAYVTAMRGLLAWVAGGARPTPAAIAAGCKGVEPAFAPETGCRFLPGFVPKALSDRVPAR